jgi:hypothetical protein
VRAFGIGEVDYAQRFESEGMVRLSFDVECAARDLERCRCPRTSAMRLSLVCGHGCWSSLPMDGSAPRRNERGATFTGAL